MYTLVPEPSPLTGCTVFSSAPFDMMVVDSRDSKVIAIAMGELSFFRSQGILSHHKKSIDNPKPEVLLWAELDLSLSLDIWIESNQVAIN